MPRLRRWVAREPSTLTQPPLSLGIEPRATSASLEVASACQTATYDPYGQPIDLATGAIGKAGTPAADDRVPDTSTGQLDYGWLGQHQRPYEHAGNIATIEMGARQYVPGLARFLSVDPVEGGSANDHDYVNANPCNSIDLDGLAPDCGSKHKYRAGRMTITITRRTGGFNKAGLRYIGYYVEVRMNGYRASVGGTRMNIRGRAPGDSRPRNLATKASWKTPWKKQWVVHHNIQVKPGTNIQVFGESLATVPPGRGAQHIAAWTTCRAR